MQESKTNFKAVDYIEDQMLTFPRIVNIEVYRGDCPCRCVHCPVGITIADKRKGRFGLNKIDFELYKKIVEEISLYSSSTLRIHSVGEPLLWDKLPDALRFTYDKKVRSWIFTCAVTNDKNILDDLCRYATIIEVSVNGTSSEDYKKNKGIDAFNLVVENIKYMHHLISKGFPSRLIVSRVQSEDKEADNEFVRYWKSTGMVDDVFIRSYHTYNELLPEISDNSLTKHEPCLVHWARFNISVDGYAVVCFNELFKEELTPSLILGDLNTETIYKIWHSPKLATIRQAELTSDYSGFDVLPCKNCCSYQPLNSNKPNSYYQIRQLEGEKDV